MVLDPNFGTHNIMPEGVPKIKQPCVNRDLPVIVLKQPLVVSVESMMEKQATLEGNDFSLMWKDNIVKWHWSLVKKNNKQNVSVFSASSRVDPEDSSGQDIST